MEWEKENKSFLLFIICRLKENIFYILNYFQNPFHHILFVYLNSILLWKHHYLPLLLEILWRNPNQLHMLSERLLFHTYLYHNHLPHNFHQCCICTIKRYVFSKELFFNNISSTFLWVYRVFAHYIRGSLIIMKFLAMYFHIVSSHLLTNSLLQLRSHYIQAR